MQLILIRRGNFKELVDFKELKKEWENDNRWSFGWQ